MKSSEASEAGNGARSADGRSGGELTIGELAGFFGLATHVLRHWESVGVLVPARRSGGQRRYTDEQRCQVALILRAQRAGMSLSRIRDALDAPDQQALRDLLGAHLDELARRMEQLREAMEMLEHSMSCQHPNIVDCPRAREILEDSTAVCTGEARSVESAHAGGAVRASGPGRLGDAVSG